VIINSGEIREASMEGVKGQGISGKDYPEAGQGILEAIAKMSKGRMEGTAHPDTGQDRVMAIEAHPKGVINPLIDFTFR
jgi:hypothetical protein